MHIFNKRLINRSFYLWWFGTTIEISLHSLNVLICWLPSSWFFYIRWVYVFFIKMIAIVRGRIAIGLEWNVMVLGNMRNRISLGVKLPLTSLCVCLRSIFLKLIIINAWLFAITDLLRNIDLGIRFRFLMLTTFIQSLSVKRILICLGVYRYIWSAIITLYSSEWIFASTQLANCFLPLKVCLWIVIFSYIDDRIVESAWGLRIK